MKTIYVALMEEGTAVWRSVAAEAVGPDVYRIAPQVPYDRVDEAWEFGPGDQVRCELRTLSDGVQALVAVERVMPGGERRGS